MGDKALAIGRQHTVIQVRNKGCEEASYIGKDQLPYRLLIQYNSQVNYAEAGVVIRWVTGWEVDLMLN